MNGIVININPVLLHLGNIALSWYSLIIWLAVVVAVLIIVHQAKKKGIAANEIYTLTFWMVVSGLVGARLFHVVDRWEYYAVNPLYIIQLQEGGLAIWGALAGGAVALFIFAKTRKLPLGRLADVMVPGLLVGQIIGRFGCIINGDAYGGITNLPWAFIYTHPDSTIPSNLFGMPTHPYPVYEMIWNTITLLVIWRLGRYFKKDGFLFLSYLLFYSMGRVTLTFVRQENVFFGGLQQAQIVAILIMVASIGAMMYSSIKHRLTKRIT